MNQAKIRHLISKLNYPLRDKPRKLRNFDGPEGRMLKLRKTLTQLFKLERIELNYHRADEARGYADQLSSQALIHGYKEKRIVELVDYYMLEKEVMYKFFYELLPRFEGQSQFTNLVNVPRTFPGSPYLRAVLELRGNPYPPMPGNATDGGHLIHNVLLNSAKKQFYKEQLEKSVDDIK